MSRIPYVTSQSEQADVPMDEQQLLQQLQRQDCNWVAIGKACQQLQEAGYSVPAICKLTGLEPSQQEQMTVAAQVYCSLEQGKAPHPVLTHFKDCHSEVLYEFRILNQLERVHAATLAAAKHLDAEEAQAVAEAIQCFSGFEHPPEGFSEHAGDAVAYQCCQLAGEQQDLQLRSRLIARGLRFAHSESARRQLESLLTDL